MKELRIQINGFKQGKEITLEIFNKFLKKDKNFHLFWEGTELHLRCDDKNITPIWKYLESKGIGSLGGTKEYVDPNADVAKYQDYFIPIFHYYTLLGIKLLENNTSSEEVERLYDRVCHLFYICNIYSIVDNSWTEKEEIGTESTILSKMLVKRAVYEGMRKYWLNYVKK